MLVHKFMMKAGSNIIVAVMSFVSLMIMTRYVGEQYGVMMWGWAFVAIFNAFTDLGFNAASMRFISRNDADRSACFSTFLFVKIALSIMAFAMTAITVAISFVTGSVDWENVMVCVVFMAYFLIYNIQTALTVTFDGLLMSGKSSIALTVESSVRSALLIVLALLSVDAVTLSLAYLVGAIVSMSITLLMMRNTNLEIRRPSMVREYARFAAPLMFSIMAIAIIEYLDKVLLGFFEGSQEVGYYAAAAGVVGAFTTLGVSLNNVLLPHLSKNEGHEGIERTIWMAEKYISILLIPVLAFIMVLGPEIAVVLYGADYSASGNMLSIQAVHIYAFIFTGIMAQILYSLDMSGVYLRASIVFAIIALIGFLILIPDELFGIQLAGLGGVGAAGSLALAYTVFSAILIRMVKRETGFKLYPGMWKLFASGVVSGLFLIACNQIIGLSGLINLAIFGILSLGVYLAILWILGGIKKDDIEFIRSALNPKNIHESITDEWK